MKTKPFLKGDWKKQLKEIGIAYLVITIFSIISITLLCLVAKLMTYWGWLG